MAMRSRPHAPLLILALLLASACGRIYEQRYTLHGQVLTVAPNHLEATIKHDEIKGFMEAMTMPYKVREARLLDGIAPGDLITATLVVLPNDAYLTEIKKVGEAPLEKISSEAPSASSRFELLRPGDAVPDAAFVDLIGRVARIHAGDDRTTDQVPADIRPLARAS
jgi:protein SCO1/2